MRAAAVACGVDWDPDALQPAAEVRSEVWELAERGYLMALLEAGKDLD